MHGDSPSTSRRSVAPSMNAVMAGGRCIASAS
jgi:hypothetical protein